MTARRLRADLLDWFDRIARTYAPVLGLAAITVAFALAASCVGTPDDGRGYLTIDQIVSTSPSGVEAATDPDPTPGSVATSTEAERGTQVAVGLPPVPPRGGRVNVADIQEGPDALLHPSVRDWEPAPFDPERYEEWAADYRGRARCGIRFRRTVEPTPAAVDPGLRRTPYLDELDRPRRWFRT